jgi:hypothetical protein
MKLESQNSSLPGNGSLNTFPQKQTHATTEVWCFMWSAPGAMLHSVPLNTSLQQWINTQQ